MRRLKELLINAIPYLVVAGTALICALFFLLGTKTDDGTYTLDGKPAQISESTKDWMESAEEAYSKIVYASKPVPALLADGSTIDVPTVEFIDGGKIEEPSKEAGMGAYVYAPTATFEEFKNYTIGKCWDLDGFAGSQCVDTANLFQMNYTKDGRWMDLCGTGAARGIWYCKEKNAGTEYDLVTSASQILTGDVIVTDGGTWGHVCQAAGPYNNGYVACLGQNQGGPSCPNGGAAQNIINLSLSTFLGAFRPKTYIQPEPTPPAPSPSGDVSTYYVSPGDTLGAIMMRNRGYIDWGDMNNYAQHWYSTVVNPGQSVYAGWNSRFGVGLYANDIIEYRP